MPLKRGLNIDSIDMQQARSMAMQDGSLDDVLLSAALQQDGENVGSAAGGWSKQRRRCG